MESLGCEASLLLLDMESEVHCLGTDKGLQYLTQNNGPIKFMEFFGMHHSNSICCDYVPNL